MAKERFVRLLPGHRDHVWSCDFMQVRTHDGRAIRLLTLIDEYTRECLAIDVARRLTSEDVLERLSDLFVRRAVTNYIARCFRVQLPGTLGNSRTGGTHFVL